MRDKRIKIRKHLCEHVTIRYPRELNKAVFLDPFLDDFNISRSGPAHKGGGLYDMGSCLIQASRKIKGSRSQLEQTVKLKHNLEEAQELIESYRAKMKLIQIFSSGVGGTFALENIEEIRQLSKEN